MATVVITTRTDDLTGQEDESVQTFKFGVDGVDYTIDLNEKNAAAFAKAIGKYVEKATIVEPEKPKRGAGKTRKPRAANGTGVKRRDMRPVREWANANGYSVGDRGRIGTDIVEAYDTAHPATEAPAVEQFESVGTELPVAG